MNVDRGGEKLPTPEQFKVDEQLNTVITWIGDRPTGADGPLAGLTAGIKDNIEVAGVRSTCGSGFLWDNVAEYDAPVVRSLEEAGATVLATLNMAEFAVGVTSQNSAAGGSRNPWDPKRVPAGSSGGAGAAVAAGLVDVALGTDSGGSVRLPASACGVCGLRPSFGLVDTVGVYPVSRDFDVVGPIARDVELVARTFDVLTHQPQRPRVRPSVIGVPKTFVTDDVDPAITAATGGLVESLRDQGYEIRQVDIPQAERAQDHVYTLLYSQLADIHRDRLRTSPEDFQPATLERVRLGLEIGERAIRDAAKARDEFRKVMRRVFEEVEVVVTPAMPVDVPLISSSESVIAQSRRLGQFSYPWSLHTGPTLVVPVGFHPGSGMPIGAQLTAGHADEAALFTVGRDYQRVTEWHERRPPIRADQSSSAGSRSKPISL
ncbi:amidase [Saccharopolyspora hordei]|uniref:Aspartyl-tRNA(Asn)/glutamyl-tRNA(Gln) amidotransferase subunit A n=1 Tax=Saccharopolyspora hordei TaxID=1838 RepID=A0A853APJ8_9PSEU|nr:amidase [Saccharopolyspora hordei]NYI85359.1 aspartyl-tRNA(Asn)/glutamyl-tRNA(Gln) amidotransferase subunit A [Saccharopolyspora hordei]